MTDLMTKDKWKKLQKKIFSSCEKSADINDFFDLKNEILALTENKKEEVIFNCFTLSCKNGNLKVINALLSDKDYGFALTKEKIESGAFAAILEKNTFVLRYLLEDTAYMQNLKKTDQKHKDYIGLCTKLLEYCAFPIDTKCLSYLIEHMHSHISEVLNKPHNVNVLKLDKYLLFKKAYFNQNAPVLTLLIKTYSLTGEEKELKKFLNILDPVFHNAMHLEVTQKLDINREKAMLNKTVRYTPKALQKNKI